jgi:hypothetical protein
MLNSAFQVHLLRPFSISALPRSCHQITLLTTPQHLILAMADSNTSLNPSRPVLQILVCNNVQQREHSPVRAPISALHFFDLPPEIRHMIYALLFTRADHSTLYEICLPRFKLITSSPEQSHSELPPASQSTRNSSTKQSRLSQGHGSSKSRRTAYACSAAHLHPRRSVCAMPRYSGRYARSRPQSSGRRTCMVSPP